MDLVVKKFKNKSRRSEKLTSDQLNSSKRIKVEDENVENENENVVVKQEEVDSTDQVTTGRQNLWNLFGPTFMEGGPPTMVPIPTNVPACPSFSSLSWLRSQLPDNIQIDYYDQLLQVIAEMRKDICPIMLGNKAASERLKRSLQQSRLLISILISQILDKDKSSDETEQQQQQQQQKQQQQQQKQQKQQQQMMVSDHHRPPSIPKGAKTQFLNPICDKPFYQTVGVSGGHRDPTIPNQLAGQSLVVPLHPAFRPLAINCPDYPDIRYDKKTGRPTTVKPGSNDQNFILYDPHDRLLMKAPKWSQDCGQFRGQNY